jgi:ubiquinone/menaquinone biosynthesis C-methylase UbiE
LQTEARAIPSASVAEVAANNEEMAEAWNGVLSERFVQYRRIVSGGLGAHGSEALRLHPPQPGEHVLDIGCGFGDTTLQVAALVGPEGSVRGFDLSERFLELARGEAAEKGLANVTYVAGDVQVVEFDRSFDYAFSRMGTMFFADPVAALRNVREALVPGGRLCMVVWRRKVDNPWAHRAEQVVERFLEAKGDPEDRASAPGPYSMADADVTSRILVEAGFEGISFQRCDIAIEIGLDLDQAVEFAMALGPAGAAIRLAGEEAEPLRPQIAAGLREALADFQTPNGVRGPASTWIVSARAPAG